MPGRITGSLQASEDIDFQRGQWRAERIGWALMIVLIVLAALGLFGKGVLSAATAQAGTIEAEYERFARLESPSELRLTIAESAAIDGSIEVIVSGDYVGAVEITRITPTPTEETYGDGLHLTFPAPDGADLSVSMHVQPVDVGLRSGEIAVVGGDSIELWQWVYP